MAVHVCYIGNPDQDNHAKLWGGAESGTTTCFATTASQIYAAANSKKPTTGDVLKLESDEYPSAIYFNANGESVHLENRTTGTVGAAIIYLCNDSATKKYEVGRTGRLHEGQWYENTSSDANGNTVVVGTYFYGSIPISNLNKGSQDWTELAGATLALRKEDPEPNANYQDTCKWIRFTGRTSVRIVTNNVARTITLNNGTGGTLTCSAATASRGQTATVTVTLNTGYELKSLTASAGTLQKITETEYKFIMATPAVNVTITAEYEQKIFNINTYAKPVEAGTVRATASANSLVDISSAISGNEVYITAIPKNTEVKVFDINVMSEGIDEATGERETIATFEPVDTDNPGEPYSPGKSYQCHFTFPTKNVDVYGNFLVHEVFWKEGILLTDNNAKWKKNTEYTFGKCVHHDNKFWICVRQHKSGSQFNASVTENDVTTEYWQEYDGIGPGLHVDQNGQYLTITMSGSAIDNFGQDISYELYKEGAFLTKFISSTVNDQTLWQATITLTEEEVNQSIEFKSVAVSKNGAASKDGAVEVVTPGAYHKTIAYYDGTKFIRCIPYYCTRVISSVTGASTLLFREIEPLYYNGSKFVSCSHESSINLSPENQEERGGE